MDKEAVSSIVSKAESGAEILFGRGNLGEHKIKVRYGPMHLMTKRYQVDAETYEYVMAKLRRLYARKHQG